MGPDHELLQQPEALLLAHARAAELLHVQVAGIQGVEAVPSGAPGFRLPHTWLDERGALLVRPDQHVAWRSRTLCAEPTDELARVMHQVLRP